MTERPVTSADREAALIARMGAAEFPPQPFDTDAGYRALKQRWAEDAGNVTQLRAPYMRPITLAGKAVPERLWIVSEWIPYGAVTSLYGDGGTGKSLIAQGLITCLATGRKWFGLPTAECRAFGYFCEDDNDELHRRQEAINRHLGLNYQDLGRMAWRSGNGGDNVLMRFDPGGYGETTPAFDDMVADCLDHKARFLVVDTAADTFGGNEIIKPQVRQFLSGCLGRVALKIAGAVLLCAHPSKSGLASGEGDGGNVAWNASVRSRLYLSRPKAEDGDNPDDSIRVLSRKKANYASIGDEIALKWDDGYYTVQQAAGGIFATIEKRSADQVFLSAVAELVAQGRNLSANTAANNYAPNIIMKAKLASNFKRKDMSDAMERALKDRTISIESYGPPSHGKQRIAIVKREQEVPE